MENSLALSGIVCKQPETRHSPAGIPLTRFTLEHQSVQTEAGMPRQARCRIIVTAAGEPLSSATRALSLGQQVTVRGFVARADHHLGRARLILHAQDIQACEVN